MKKSTQRGYAINHPEKTITLTKAYAKRANTPGTKEFRELAQFHKNYPDYDIVMRTATPNENKERHTGLSVARMEVIIKQMVKEEEAQEKALAEYNEAKDFYKGTKGYYGKIKAWFLKNYEGYAEVDFAA